MSNHDIIIDAGYRRLREPGNPDPNAELVPSRRDGKLQLNLHLDARGGFVELWRQSWDDVPKLEFPHTAGMVRQAYISMTSPGVVKAWHCHAVQTDRLVALRGRVLLCTFDLTDRGAMVVERVLDANYPERVDIPPLHAHGWMALGTEEAWILNLVSHEYDGCDEHRRDPHSGPCSLPGHGPDSVPDLGPSSVKYDWHRRRDG